MKPWQKTVTLPVPLRDAHLFGAAEQHPMDALFQDAREAGYNQGRIDGEKALSEQLVKQRADINDLSRGVLTALRQAVPQVIQETETTLLSLAMEVARKLVADSPISVQMMEAVLRDALTHVEGSTQITVRLHGEDLVLLQAAGSHLLESTGSDRTFTFVAAPEVQRGGCLIETRFGTVDARRETKFDLIKETLLA